MPSELVHLVNRIRQCPESTQWIAIAEAMQAVETADAGGETLSEDERGIVTLAAEAVAMALKQSSTEKGGPWDLSRETEQSLLESLTEECVDMLRAVLLRRMQLAGTTHQDGSLRAALLHECITALIDRDRDMQERHGDKGFTPDNWAMLEMLREAPDIMAYTMAIVRVTQGR